MQQKNKKMQIKYVLITGGSSGIGYALAKQFAADGYAIVLAASNEAKLLSAKENLIEQYGVFVQTYALDLTKQGAAEILYKSIKKDRIQIDVLVNNAGIGTIGATEQISIEEDEAMMALNMITPVIFIGCFSKHSE